MLRKSLYKDLDKFRKTRNSQKRKYYNKTVNAANKYLPWTKQEDILVIQHNIPDKELSVKIQRSMNAILTRRNRLKNKIINNVIKENKEMKVLKYKRGQIWWYKMPNSFDGSIQGKIRPVIIMSNDLANEHSNCLLAIPCTTAEKKQMPTHTIFKINDSVNSTALAENLMSINVTRLENYMGMVDDDLLTRLEYTVMVALGLEKYTNIPSPTNPIPIETQLIPTVIDSNSLTEQEPELEINKNNIFKTRKSRQNYTQEEKIKFIKDYENHTVRYMLDKYDMKDKKALTNKVYMFRKSMGIRKNKRRV